MENMFPFTVCTINSGPKVYSQGCKGKSDKEKTQGGGETYKTTK